MHTTATITFVLSLLSIPYVSAGQHTGSSFRNARRHHARMAQPMIQRAASCEEASWQCSGSELQRCIGSQWIAIQNCSGQDIICSAESGSTGCIWAWAVQQGSAGPSSFASPPSSSASTMSTNPTSMSPTASAPSPTETIEECGPDDLDDGSDDSSSAVPSQSVIGGGLAGINGGGHSWYTQSTNEWDSASIIPGSASPTGTSTAGWTSGDASATAGWSSGSVSGWSASATTSGQDQWGQPSASGSSSSWQDASANASAPTDAPSSGSSRHASKMTSWTVTETGTAAPSASSGSSGSSGGGSPGHWSAPHYAVYTDYGIDKFPDASEVTDFNRFILAFWMSDRGAVDMAQMWEWMDAGARQKMLDSYHAAGIAIMVSAFGSTDSPVTSGVDPADCARRLAAWVKQYKLDGVDIDWEDMQAMNTGHGEAWLISFQAELRNHLPAGQYLISHAPVAPWFTSGPDYENGAYVKVHKEVGSGIDFYNIQFYNQGEGVYTDCHSLIEDSGASSWPDTSVMEINSFAGVPLSKIVIGKPIDAGAASNGYMDPGMLSQCVSQAEAKGWNGGIMYWQWDSNAPRVMAASKGH